MPDTPFAWAPAVTVTQSGAGNNSSPQIAQLSNGDFAVSWLTDDDATPGRVNGNSVLARKYTPVAELAPGTSFPGGNYHIDLRSSNTDDYTFLSYPSAVRGGVIVAVSSQSTVGERRSILMSELVADLSASAGVSSSLQIDDSEITPNYDNPHLALSDASAALTVFERNGEDGPQHGEIVGRFYNALNNTYGARFSIMDIAGADISTPQVAALANGTFAVVAVHDTGTGTELLYRIVNTDGEMVTDIDVVGPTRGNGADLAPVIAAVGTPGQAGFVIAWENDGPDPGVSYQLFGIDGTPGATFDSGTGGSAPAIAPLLDRGFAIVQTVANGLELRRYDAGGAQVGAAVTIDGSGLSDPNLHQLSDGRIVLAWVDGSDIRMQVFDIRDTTTLGRHADGNWQIGTEADDRILDTVDAIFTTIHGWRGNDIITLGPTGNRAVFGGDGNDYITAGLGIVTGVTLQYDGGLGRDTLDFDRISQPGLTFDLEAGVIRLDGSAQTQGLTGFEEIIATAGDDAFTDGAGATHQRGGDGNDSFLLGPEGADTLDGGPGTNSIGLADDRLALLLDLEQGAAQVGAAAKTVRSITNATGGEAADRLIGDGADNLLEGAKGDDTLNGAGGDDTLVAGLGNDLVIGGAGSDRLMGDAGNDTLRSEGGSDLLTGDQGEDVLDLRPGEIFGTGFVAHNASSAVQVGTDVRVSVTGKGRFEAVSSGGDGADVISLSDGSDAFFLHDSYSAFHASLTLAADQQGRDSHARFAGIEVIRAGAGDDIIDLTSPDYGMSGLSLRVEGEDGADILWGASSHDVLVGGTGNDTLFGGAGRDRLVGGAGADVFELTRTSTATTLADLSASDGDRVRFYNTGDAVFDHGSLALTQQGFSLSYTDGATNQVRDLAVFLEGAGALSLPELTTLVEII